MECYYHPNKEGVNTCAICGKSVCEECSLEIAGKMYCKECLEKIVGIKPNNEENSNVESKPEPVRLGKKEENETSIYQAVKEETANSIPQTPKKEKTKFANDLSIDLNQPNENIYSANLQEKSSIYDTTTQPDSYKEESVEKSIANDSPYNINEMDYTKKAEETANSIPQTPKKEKTKFANDLSIDLNQPNENIYSANLQEKSSIYDTTTQPDSYKEESVEKSIANDSPYNINEMDYTKKAEETQRSYFRKESAPYLDPRTNINQDYNQRITSQETPQSAQNEFDYYPQEQIAPQQQTQQEYIYPDHTFEPEETSARKALEDKYEKYLDDLYFDEQEIPLDEQLAKDEEKYGSLTKKPYVPPSPQQLEEEYMQQIHQRESYIPQTPRKQEYIPQTNEAQMYTQQQNYYPPEERRAQDQELDRQIRDQLNIRKEKPKSKKAHNNIKYEEDGKDSFGVVDLILTIILIIAILVVLFYIIYIFFLSSSYPTFLDAIFALQNPGDVINNLMG